MGSTNDRDDCDAEAFQNHDSLGDDSNVLLRPLRQLFAEGKPPGQITPLVFRHGEQLTYPFGALYAGHNRICFWPAYPKGTDMATQPDHITLELPNRKSHWTGFDADGKKYRLTGQGTSWKLYQFPDSVLAWWFPMLVQWDTLENQDRRIQRKVRMESEGAKKHTIDEFAEYATRLTNPVVVPLPAAQELKPNYVLFSAYVSVDGTVDAEFRGDMFPSDYVASKVAGWDDHTSFPVQAIRVACGIHKLIFAVGCPPGVLDAAVWVGLPKKKVDRSDGSSSATIRDKT